MKESEFKFLGYRISKIHSEITNNFGEEKEIFSQSINIKDRFDKKNNRFVEVTMNIDVKTKSKCFEFSVQIKGAFQASKEMPDNAFKNLAKCNAPAILLPFARALIASCTAQANIPAVVLPIINLSSISSDKISSAISRKKYTSSKR